MEGGLVSSGCHNGMSQSGPGRGGAGGVGGGAGQTAGIFFSHTSGGREFKIKMWADLVCSEASLLGLQMAALLPRLPSVSHPSASLHPWWSSVCPGLLFLGGQTGL